jgi:hypothetical protein
MIDGAWRLWRGLFVGLAIVSIAVLGHVLAGGSADIRSQKFVVLALLALPLAIRLSDREWTTWRLFATLAAAQVVIHVALQVRLFAPNDMGAMSGPPSMHMAAVGPLSPQSTMLFSHFLAVVVTAFLLRRGEDFVLGIRARLASALFTVVADVCVPAPAPRLVAVATRPATLRVLSDSLGAVTRRGPPWTAAVRLYA